MLTFSIGFGWVAGIGPRVRMQVPPQTITTVKAAIRQAARHLGGAWVCTTDGHGVDELGEPEPCSIVVVNIPEEHAARFREFLAGLAGYAEQRCFGVLAAETEFIGTREAVAS
jgi:hypothetical protein